MEKMLCYISMLTGRSFRSTSPVSRQVLWLYDVSDVVHDGPQFVLLVDQSKEIYSSFLACEKNFRKYWDIWYTFLMSKINMRLHHSCFSFSIVADTTRTLRKRHNGQLLECFLIASVDTFREWSAIMKAIWDLSPSRKMFLASKKGRRRNLHLSASCSLTCTICRDQSLVTFNNFWLL